MYTAFNGGNYGAFEESDRSCWTVLHCKKTFNDQINPRKFLNNNSLLA